MRLIVGAFKNGFERDVKLTYEYWSVYRQAIRIHTYSSVTISTVLGIYLYATGYAPGGWLIVSSAVVFLSYHFNNSTFLIASRLPIKNPDGEGRYEYLDRQIWKTIGQWATHPLYFAFPYILYVLILVVVVMRLV